MLFMVIEHFDQARVKDVYRRLRDEGRAFSDKATYINSWISADFSRCFQLMECDDVTVLQEWVARSGDLLRFEIIPVSASKDVSAMIAKHL